MAYKKIISYRVQDTPVWKELLMACVTEIHESERDALNSFWYIFPILKK
jgi:hypothetical protein